MPDFALRASGYEYMDEASTTGPDLGQCLRELERVNRFLGGVRGTTRAMGELLADRPGAVSVLDLGSGAADVPRALVRWGRRRGIAMRVTAVDFNPAVAQWARARLADVPEVEVEVADAMALPFAPGAFDIVHAGLFLHHFDDERAVVLLRKMYQLCRRGLIVNDLHRHPLAYGGIRLFDALFSQSRMARHDGPQSVLRGFRGGELRALGRRAGVDLAPRWRWAFRWVATAVK